MSTSLALAGDIRIASENRTHTNVTARRSGRISRSTPSTQMYVSDGDWQMRTVNEWTVDTVSALLLTLSLIILLSVLTYRVDPKASAPVQAHAVALMINEGCDSPNLSQTSCFGRLSSYDCHACLPRDPRSFSLCWRYSPV
jgi:hypothetical protein